MQYDPALDDHGLPFSPFKSCCIPRPIGWISTVSKEGVDNLAPYSQFQNLTFEPPIVMFAANQSPDGERKDSVENAEQTGEFVWNMATYELREAVNLSAMFVDGAVDEFEVAGLEKAPSVVVKPKRVARSPVHFECKYMQTLRLPGEGVMGTVDVVIGKVVRIHVKDEFILSSGKLDVLGMKPLARLGYYDYTYINEIFEMKIPDPDGKMLGGLEGRPEK